ncbi:DCC1-like thiol-disulfide oxidoreductase family protein [Haloarcula sp. NS06]|uniref:DCC1-like thiol-disulfide oxidoreductase family protein n=1 Tax=Haloarcula sp. NS06 TaxID=3409688 RepID=UPI003DA78C0B
MTNYFKNSVRASPVNTAFARVLLSLYILWKIHSYDWLELTEWPSYLLPHYLITPPSWAVVSLGVATVALAAVIVGYRLRVSAFIAAVAVSHLGILRASSGLSGSEQSMQIAAYILVFIALYSESDYLTIDKLRQTSEKPLADLNSHLKDHPTDDSFAHPVLKYALLLVTILYFGSGVGKVIKGPIQAWIQPESLARYIVAWGLKDQTQPLMGLFLNNELLLWLSTIGTLVLELGFLIAVVVGVAIWPFLLGMAAMHVVIALSVGPFFIDQLVFLGLFVPWDRLYSRWAHDEPLDIVYDEHCYFCNQSLHIFPYLDINDTVTFYSQYTVPEEYKDREGTDFESAMFAFRDDKAYRGYWAFRELLRQFTVFAPLVWLMGFPPVAAVGERVYQYIADNRDRHFTCSVDLGEEADD